VGEHPTTAELKLLLDGGLDREAKRVVVRHLLTGCPSCCAVIAAQAQVLFPRPPADAARATPSETAAPAPAPAARALLLSQVAAATNQTAASHAGRDGGISGSPAASRPSRLAAAWAVEPSLTPATPAAPTTPTALAARNHTPDTHAFPDLPDLPERAPAEHTAGGAKSAAAAAVDGTSRETSTGPAAPGLEVNAAYDRAIDRALASVARYGTQASRESKRVKQVLAVLEEKGIAGFCELPAHLRGLAGYEALLERSWSLRHDDPRQMVQLGELATVVASGLSAKRYGGEQVRDLQCRAAIELANAYRVIGRPEEAQASLNEALEFFRMGTQDRLMAARLFVIQAQVSGDRRNFDTALAAFDSAIRVYRDYGEPHQVGDTLIKKGMYCGYACRQDEALKTLNEGLALIDPVTHPELALLAVHNLANILVDCAKYREARTLLWRNQPLYERHGGRVLRLKVRLLTGRIHAGIDEPERAERDFVEARNGFADIGQPYMATLVLLDMAVLHIRQGRDEDARREALEAADIFLGLNIGREAAVAMMLLKSTVKFRLAATALLLEEMAEFMRAAEHDPQLSFHSFVS
jgi:tetratricopeptide (TPR) repeat protein